MRARIRVVAVAADEVISGTLMLRWGFVDVPLPACGRTGSRVSTINETFGVRRHACGRDSVRCNRARLPKWRRWRRGGFVIIRYRGRKDGNGGSPDRAGRGTATGGIGANPPTSGASNDEPRGGEWAQGGIDGVAGTIGDPDPDAEGAAGGGFVGPVCGNQVKEVGENCDDGALNGPGKACNALCKTNVCGDGDKGPSEVCDNGSENGLGLARCAPDCSALIGVKHIVVATTELPNSQLQPNPVAKADSLCKTGYKAFFAYGTARRATTSPLKAVNPVDWVIRPYTYYYTKDEKPIWLTDAVPLLGVRNGMFASLENPISSTNTFVILTGLNADYTTLSADNCGDWSSVSTSDVKRYGRPATQDINFMHADDTVECGTYTVSFYCVEQ